MCALVENVLALFLYLKCEQEAHISGTRVVLSASPESRDRTISRSSKTMDIPIEQSQNEIPEVCDKSNTMSSTEAVKNDAQKHCQALLERANDVSAASAKSFAEVEEKMLHQRERWKIEDSRMGSEADKTSQTITQVEEELKKMEEKLKELKSKQAREEQVRKQRGEEWQTEERTLNSRVHKCLEERSESERMKLWCESCLKNIPASRKS